MFCDYVNQRDKNTDILNKLDPWSGVLPEKLTAAKLVKKSSFFCGTRRFISA